MARRAAADAGLAVSFPAHDSSSSGGARAGRRPRFLACTRKRRNIARRLSIVPIDIAMQSTIAGSGSATAILKGNTLTINGTFSGLKTAATVARVHRSPRTGMRGVPIGDLTATAETSGTISGSIELTKEQIDDLAAGRLVCPVA